VYIKNCWYVAAWDTEIDATGLFSRKILGVQIVLFRGADGKVGALEDKCCHRLAPLSRGRIEGNCVRCMYHGLMFDAAGKCVDVPGQERINDKLRVRSFPVFERDRFIWIWMGDPALADHSAIYDSHWHDCADWKAERGGYMHYQSNFELIADNLLDFSHLAFVHQSTIGSARQAEVKPVVERLENAIRIKYFTLASSAPPFARKLSKLPEIVDRFQTYTWNIKGNYFVQDSVIANVGEGLETKSEIAMRLHTTIALTPETEHSTHYFWSTAHTDFHPELEGITKVLTDQVASAFEEDRNMIDAQQKVIDEASDTGMVAIPSDAALMQARWMLRNLLKEEAQQYGAASTISLAMHRT
jgi:phenylpropionate dioxygenase-like ring-hydroxylating dioxygenase large terminal subunit